MDQPAPTPDLEYEHAVATTRLEDVWTEVWQDLRDAGEYELARAVRHAGGNAEHYHAGLPVHPDQVTEHQSEVFRGLLDIFDGLIAQAGSRTGKKYGR